METIDPEEIIYSITMQSVINAITQRLGDNASVRAGLSGRVINERETILIDTTPHVS